MIRYKITIKQNELLCRIISNGLLSTIIKKLQPFPVLFSKQSFTTTPSKYSHLYHHTLQVQPPLPPHPSPAPLPPAKPNPSSVLTQVANPV